MINSIISTSLLSRIIAPTSRSIRVLDAVFGQKDRDNYKERHIPGALPFDILKCADHSSPYSSTFPSPGLFTDYVQDLGIDNDTHVVVYDSFGKVGMFSSPRVWWMFQAFGHSKVSVLDGGLMKWITEGHPVTDVITETEKGQFEANFQQQMLKKYEDMVSNINSKEFQVMDARSFPRFMGEEPEPREMSLRGHIPNAISVPYSSVFKEGGSVLKDREELQQMFKEKEIDFNKPLAATCGSGISACIITLAAHVAGISDLSVFDGSWEEYGQRASPALVEPFRDCKVGS